MLRAHPCDTSGYSCVYILSAIAYCSALAALVWRMHLTLATAYLQGLADHLRCMGC